MGTHDFISFPVMLDYMPARTWLLMGEIQATVQQMNAIPIRPTDVYELDLEYLAKGIQGTVAIEGNTLTEDEVDLLLKGEMSIAPARIEEAQQVLNMLEVFNAVQRDTMSGEPPPFSLELLNRYHRMILQRLNTGDVQGGAIRSHNVEIGRYLAPPPDDCELLLRQFCDWLNADEVGSDGFAGYDLAWSIVKAVVAHVYFAWIHPYGDGNGRMARLIEYAVLVRAGVPEAAALLPSYFYSKTRFRYYRELQESHGEFREGAYPASGDLRMFLEYALEGFMDELDEQMLVIGSMQALAIWRDHIRSSFPADLTSAQRRQVRLAIDLTDRCVDMPIEFWEIKNLSPALKAAYADKSDRTLQRDLDTLLEMQLLTKDYHGNQPNKEILMAFFARSGDSAD